jgi:hypothetical protein
MARHRINLPALRVAKGPAAGVDARRRSVQGRVADVAHGRRTQPERRARALEKPRALAVPARGAIVPITHNRHQGSARMVNEGEFSTSLHEMARRVHATLPRGQVRYTVDGGSYCHQTL